MIRLSHSQQDKFQDVLRPLLQGFSSIDRTSDLEFARMAYKSASDDFVTLPTHDNYWVMCACGEVYREVFENGTSAQTAVEELLCLEDK